MVPGAFALRRFEASFEGLRVCEDVWLEQETPGHWRVSDFFVAMFSLEPCLDGAGVKQATGEGLAFLDALHASGAVSEVLPRLDPLLVGTDTTQLEGSARTFLSMTPEPTARALLAAFPVEQLPLPGAPVGRYVFARWQVTTQKGRVLEDVWLREVAPGQWRVAWFLAQPTLGG
jgi:hypothetical protein